MMIRKNTRRNFIRQLSLTGAVTLAGSNLLQSAALKNDLPFAGAGTILFQGDSITEGGRDNSNWNHYFGQDYAYLIASRLGYEYPALDLNIYNRGISGNRVRDLAARWDVDTIAIKPDILSILVGVNDAYWVLENGAKDTVEGFYKEYDGLLNKTLAALPGVKLVICEPFILPVGMVIKKPEWNAGIQQRQAVVKELAKKYDCLFIPLQDEFNKALLKAPADHWIWDGIHPKPAGHELIARKWLGAANKHFHLH